VRTDLLDHLERGVLLEREDLRDGRERRGQRETPEPWAPQERRAPLAPRASQGNQEPRACVDFLDQWVSKDHLVHLDRRDLLDLWDHQVCQASEETLAPRERRVTQVSLD